MTTRELSENIKNLTLDTSLPGSMSATASEANSEAPTPTEHIDPLPSFNRPATSKISEDFKIARRLPIVFWAASLTRDLVLGWPAPSDTIIDASIRRYRKEYQLESFQGTLCLFVSLLQQRLQCFEIAAERCLPHDVTDPDPNGSEVTRSFDCIGISTTRRGKNLLRAKVTEAQYLWLVDFFGAPPVWYWYFEPRHIM